MSFNAGAVGATRTSRHFTFPNRVFPDEGDVFDIASAINDTASRLNVDLDDSSSDAFELTINAGARYALLNPLVAQLATLAFDERRSGAEIWLSAYSPGGVLSGGSFASRTSYLTANSRMAMAASFLQDMAACGLNRWGFVAAVLRILAEYNECALPARPWCSISFGI